MAGDWMKIELDLPDKPEVHYIACVTKLDCDSVVGKLVRVWAWFDKHTSNGNALGVTFALVDRLVSVTGFGEAMSFAGWLEQNDKNLTMPKFDRHTSKSAKKRALNSERQSTHRVKSEIDQNDSNADVTQTVTHYQLPEKRREDSTTLSILPSETFLKFWKAYPRKEAKQNAVKAWGKLRLQNGEFEKIMSALESAKAGDQWRKDGGQFIPHAATWLNGRRFEDEQVAAQSTEQRSRQVAL